MSQIPTLYHCFSQFFTPGQLQMVKGKRAVLRYFRGGPKSTKSREFPFQKRQKPNSPESVPKPPDLLQLQVTSIRGIKTQVRVKIRCSNLIALQCCSSNTENYSAAAFVSFVFRINRWPLMLKCCREREPRTSCCSAKTLQQATCHGKLRLVANKEVFFCHDSAASLFGPSSSSSWVTAEERQMLP